MLNFTPKFGYKIQRLYLCTSSGSGKTALIFMLPASSLNQAPLKATSLQSRSLKSTSRTSSRCFRLDQKRRNILLPCYSPCGESSSGRGKGAGLCELIINIPPPNYDKWGVLDTFPTYIYCNPEGMCEVFRTPLFLLTIGVLGHRWGYSHIERTQCRLKDVPVITVKLSWGASVE